MILSSIISPIILYAKEGKCFLKECIYFNGDTMRLINEEVITANIKRILKTNDLILVVKDNAYGIGLPVLIRIAKKLKLKEFAVINLEEALKIKEDYPEAEILILGKVKPSDVVLIKKHDLIPTINDYDDYILFKENNIPCHLGIDTGMNRFGMKTGYLALINDHLIKAIYTHLYSDDNEEKIKFIEEIAQKYNKPLHIGGSLAYGKTKAKLRIGCLLYENSLSLYGQIITIKKVNKGETIGYEGLYTASDDCVIGVCNIGYSNGLNLYYNGKVVINDLNYKVIGKVCMDHCFILIDDMVKLYDRVEFFGNKIRENDFISANNMTKYQLYLNIN